MDKTDYLLLRVCHAIDQVVDVHAQITKNLAKLDELKSDIESEIHRRGLDDNSVVAARKRVAVERAKRRGGK